MVEVGCVYLVGAGPGDPDLLTVKACRLLEQADVVVYDRLVSDEILNLVPTGNARIFVGKESGRHHMPQDEINELLVSLAKANKKVVRLKGGDPFIFGRGSEEALYLASHSVAFEVVPGVTAASGISAALGLPLTHRGMATGVRFATGHCRVDAELDLDWAGMADPETTIVFYMGLSSLPIITKELMAAGLDGDTPVVAVTNGTTPDQRQCLTTLEKLSEKVVERKFQSPVLIVIGRVASLTEPLNWQNLEYEEIIEEAKKIRSLGA